ncbi:hypothetical protein GmHk_15G043251 [Glycine max]|uniref:Uncharacterized protein n=1 Tax=Glycine max TaxID=3847 RepID=K7MAI6_SOYBN|nr:hypothetical protein GYH30_041847 [Glycine max]KAH1208436.1 hypothetical protein GmHk_15G043251 [Glycine max]
MALPHPFCTFFSTLALAITTTALSQWIKISNALLWLPWFTTWDAYHALRDKGYHPVYWSVRKDGFYHSWDGSKWKLLEDWYTE